MLLTPGNISRDLAYPVRRARRVSGSLPPSQVSRGRERRLP
jgi:hypothetical protein